MGITGTGEGSSDCYRHVCTHIKLV